MQLANKRRNTVLIIFFLISLLIFIPVLVWGIGKVIELRSKATQQAPQDIIMSNLSISSANISWVTPQKAVIGHIKYSTTISGLDTAAAKIALDDRDIANNNVTENRFTHFVTLTDLQEDTTYHYIVVSGNKEFSPNNPLSFKTPKTQAESIETPQTLYGEIEGLSSSGDSDKNALIYVTLNNNTYPRATYTTNSGTWVIQASQFLKTDLSGYANVTSSSNVTLIADAGNLGGKTQGSVKEFEDKPITIALNPTYAKGGLFSSKTIAEANVGSDTSSQATSTPETTTEQTTEATTTEPTLTTTEPTAITPTTTVDYGKWSNVISNNQDIPLTAIEDITGVGGPVDIPLSTSELKMTNNTESSFSLIWLTEEKLSTKVLYGTSSTELTDSFYDDRDPLGEHKSYLLHHSTLKGLSPQQLYYYQADSTDIPVQSATMPDVQEQPPLFDTITGQITGGKGECLVLFDISRSSKKSAPISSLADDNLNWSVNLGAVRTSDLTQYFNTQDDDVVALEGFCVNEETYYTGSLSKPYKKLVDKIVDLSVSKISVATTQATLNNIYSLSQLDSWLGVGSGGASLPATGIFNQSNNLAISLGLVSLAIGLALLTLNKLANQDNKWENTVITNLGND